MIRRRRWLQFSLRSVLLIMTTACLCLGWHVETERRRREALKAIEAMGGHIGYDRDNRQSPVLVMFTGNPVENDDGTLITPALTDEGLCHIGWLADLDSLLISDAPVTDAGLWQLYGLQNLRQITFDQTRVTRAGVAELKRALPGCEIDWQP